LNQQQKDQAGICCENCQTFFSPKQARCPQCGMPRPGVATGTLTSLAWFDVILGFIACLAVSLTGVGIVGALVVFFTMREKYRAFTNGVAGGCTVLILLLFGLIALCFGGGLIGR
jgi:RNA polymerase subunit RPABC4/transcription elongation factor Spt4